MSENNLPEGKFVHYEGDEHRSPWNWKYVRLDILRKLMDGLPEDSMLACDPQGNLTVIDGTYTIGLIDMLERSFESYEQADGGIEHEMDEKISVTLRKETWENIFRVLKWCAPMKLGVHEDAYLAQNGEHWSLGNFWAAIQSAQQQVSDAGSEG